MNKTAIIMDCDPGQDDAIALMLAAANLDKVDFLGVTTVAGNQTGDLTSRNALRVLTLIGATKIPVARGCDAPMLRKLRTAPEIHGKSGLDGAALPEPGFPLDRRHAIDFLIETIMAQESVVLVPTGPLTNVGLAFLREPRIKDHIERIVLMGGAMDNCNTTPAAEFNIYVDPEAARIVFKSGLPITMVELDATHKAFFSPDDVAALRALNGRISSVIADLLSFYIGSYRAVFGINGAPLHDPLAMAEAIHPGICRTHHWFVDIETQGELTTGETVVDRYGVTGKKPNCDVALDLDLPRFKTMIFDAIKKLDAGPAQA